MEPTWEKLWEKLSEELRIEIVRYLFERFDLVYIGNWSSQHQHWECVLRPLGRRPHFPSPSHTWATRYRISDLRNLVEVFDKHTASGQTHRIRDAVFNMNLCFRRGDELSSFLRPHRDLNGLVTTNRAQFIRNFCVQRDAIAASSPTTGMPFFFQVDVFMRLYKQMREPNVIIFKMRCGKDDFLGVFRVAEDDKMVYIYLDTESFIEASPRCLPEGGVQCAQDDCSVADAGAFHKFMQSTDEPLQRSRIGQVQYISWERTWQASSRYKGEARRIMCTPTKSVRIIARSLDKNPPFGGGEVFVHRETASTKGLVEDTGDVDDE